MNNMVYYRNSKKGVGMREPVKLDSIYTQFGKFDVGQPVTYSVYPLIWEGLGMATEDGILTVGQTYSDFILNKDGSESYSDLCKWENVYDVKPRLIGLHGKD